MRRKTMSLGLAIAAMLLLGGVYAGNAGAAEAKFTAAQYPATLEGSTLEGKEQVFGLAGSEFHCEELELSGEATSASTTATLTPTYSGCAWSSYSASVSMNGCAYVLHLGEEIESDPDRHHASLDLECPEGKKMQITTAEGQCQISIPPQNAIATTEVKNQAEDVTLDFALEGIEHTVVNGGAPCPLIEGAFENGTYAGSATLAASSGEKAVAFDAFGSTPEPFPAQLVVEEPTIIGEDEEIGKLTTRGRTVTCSTVTYHSDAENLDTAIGLTPTYSGCHTAVAGSVATITNTGCKYILELTGEAAPGGADAFTPFTDLDCGDGAAHIQIDVWFSKAAHGENKTPTCAYTFSDTHEGKAVNQDLAGIELTNKAAGEGTPANWITADVDVTGIVSTRVIGSTLLCGALLDKAGALQTKVKLKAETEGGQEIGATISTHAE
jgi:hypothetical protein